MLCVIAKKRLQVSAWIGGGITTMRIGLIILQLNNIAGEEII